MIKIKYKQYIEDGSRDFGRTVEFHNGQVIGIFGKNGAGKSSFLKTIMGVKPYAEDLELHIVDDSEFTYKSLNDMAYITDGQYLYDDMNALEHKKFFACFYEKFNSERFDKLMELFELDGNLPVNKYSKGQRSKLELALGFSKGTKYIFMDEPFIGNDPFMRNDFLKIMAGFLEEDSILVIATHYMEEIENFIDRAIFMHDRKIQRDVSMDEIMESGKGLIGTAKEVFGIDENRVLKLFLEEE